MTIIRGNSEQFKLFDENVEIPIFDVLFESNMNITNCWAQLADPLWKYRDKAKHTHQYYYRRADGKRRKLSEIGENCTGDERILRPSLRWVIDEEAYTDEDGEEYPQSGHYECRKCGETIYPATKLTNVHFAGLPDMFGSFETFNKIECGKEYVLVMKGIKFRIIIKTISIENTGKHNVDYEVISEID